MNKRKSLLTRFEKILYAFTILVLVSFPVMSIFAKSALSKINYEVESKKEEISKEKKSNESLQMKINELESLDNLEEVAESKGLGYTNSSIKTIE